MKKIHTTNYFNTFIVIADDCPTNQGEVPPTKGDAKTAANIQFELIAKNPYRYTSDEVLFQVYATKNDLTPKQHAAAKDAFFSKGQPCLRASPLTKRYGWGVHYNQDGKMAIYGAETPEYQRLLKEKKVTVLKAMKSSR
ncbi:MAG: hypothetical protein EAY81_08605 [Bacteroidetes bacterium]|nr:MAG: hypothetical protein EAY81_08605 [Bacteroidota bacterium]